MTGKRDVLEISCKVLGLFCLIQGIPTYMSSMSSVAFMDRHLSNVLAFIVWPLAFHLIAAFVLFKWARGIASLLIREDQPVEIKVDQGWQKSVYTLCLRVVGAVAVIKAVPSIIRVILQILFRSRFGAAIGVTTSVPWLSFIGLGVHLALGIYFIGGAKEVVRIVMKGSLRKTDSDKT